MRDQSKVFSACVMLIAIIAYLGAVAGLALQSACTNPKTGAELSPYAQYETAQDLYATVYAGVLENYDLGLLDLQDLGKFVKAARLMEASLRDWRAQLGPDGRYLTSEGAARVEVVRAALRRFLIEWQAKSLKSNVVPGRAPSTPGPTARMGGGGGTLASLALCLAVNAAMWRRRAA